MIKKKYVYLNEIENDDDFHWNGDYQLADVEVTQLQYDNMVSRFNNNKKYILVSLPKYRLVKYYVDDGGYHYLVRSYPNELEKRQVRISNEQTLYMSVGIFWRAFIIVD